MVGDDFVKNELVNRLASLTYKRVVTLTYNGMLQIPAKNGMLKYL